MASDRTAGLPIYGTAVEVSTDDVPTSGVITVSLLGAGVGRKWRIFGWSLTTFNSGNTNNNVTIAWLLGIDGGQITTSCTNQNLGTPYKENRWESQDYWPAGCSMDTGENQAVIATATVSGTTPQLSTPVFTFYARKMRI